MSGDCWVSYACYFPNENYDADPELGELLRDKRFRQALSLAMNRDEINEKTALGQGTSIQATCNWACPWYKDEWGTAYADYDPDQANQILDDIGLDNRDGEGFRTKPSGEELSVIIECTTAIPYWVPISELVKAHWDAVGVRTILKVDEWDLLFARLGAGEIQIFTWYTGHMPFTLLARKAHVPREMSRWAPKWWAWVDSGGEEGEEPPDDVKRLYELGEAVAVTPPDEVNAVMQEFYDDQAESLRILGTIGYIGKPAISNKQLGNVDMEAYGDNSDTGGTRNSWLDLLYWKEA
jgi:peptide/nickel transport system substrate-binding protein